MLRVFELHDALVAVRVWTLCKRGVIQDVLVRAALVFGDSRGDWLVICAGFAGRELPGTGCDVALWGTYCTGAMLDALSLVTLYRPEEVGEESESLTLIFVLDEAAVPVVEAPLSFTSLE